MGFATHVGDETETGAKRSERGIINVVASRQDVGLFVYNREARQNTYTNELAGSGLRRGAVAPGSDTQGN